MSQTSSSAPLPLRKGMAITDADGKQIGTIGGLNESSFKVNAPMARDYWLPRTVIAETADTGIVLSVAHERLDEVRIALGEENIDLEQVERESEVDDPADADQRDEAQAEYLKNPHQFS